MKYFAKYLPIEGEIKIGDRVESESISKNKEKLKVIVTAILSNGNYVTDG